MELPSLENVCKRAFGTGVEGKMEVSRNITGFQPCLNDFIVQYNLASDKTTILQKLVRNSEKCGFSVLSKAVNDYLLESNPTNQLNVYSMLVISAIQVKDDTLLSYILDDISHFLPVNNNVIYEVLKRVCHYRKYPQLIQFLDEYMNIHPEAFEDKRLCEMGLYLTGKDSNDNREFATILWDKLLTFPVTTEEEYQQRVTDLGNILNVCMRMNDWPACSVILHSEYTTIMHVARFLRGVASTPSPDVPYLISAYLDYHSIIYQSVNESSLKDLLFIVDLMLDLFKLSHNTDILNIVVNDIVNTEGFILPEKQYSRLTRLCLQNQCSSEVFSLYCYHEGQYESVKLYRKMESFIHKLEGDSVKVQEMKRKVYELHYSNTSVEEEEEKKDNGLVFDEDEFIEEDVLQILKNDFKVKRLSGKEERKHHQFKKSSSPDKGYRKRDRTKKNDSHERKPGKSYRNEWNHERGSKKSSYDKKGYTKNRKL